jgi:hypothetical protein
MQDVSSFKDYQRLARLYEFYQQPDTSWVRIMMERVYENFNLIDEIGKEYNVKWETKENNSGRLVSEADYNVKTNEITIYLSNRAIDAILKKRLRTRIAEEIEKTIVHEKIHDQQNQLNQSKQPYQNSFTDHADYLKYLSQYQEIDAFAKQVAKIMEDRNYSEKDVAAIRSLQLPEIEKRLVEDYYEIGGDVLKKFLNEVYRWFTEPPIGNEFDYKEWLRKHA